VGSVCFNVFADKTVRRCVLRRLVSATSMNRLAQTAPAFHVTTFATETMTAPTEATKPTAVSARSFASALFVPHLLDLTVKTTAQIFTRLAHSANSVMFVEIVRSPVLFALLRHASQLRLTTDCHFNCYSLYLTFVFDCGSRTRTLTNLNGWHCYYQSELGEVSRYADWQYHCGFTTFSTEINLIVNIFAYIKHACL